MEAVTEPLGQGAFSMELSEDQRDVREWVHGFAANVVRPAAAEWDEREETPWPLIQEAAKIGLYWFEALAQFYADETGLLLPIVNEELFWGDAGHRHVDHGHDARGRGDLLQRHAASSSASGCRSATARRTIRRSARSACPSPTRAPTSARCARRARYDEAKDEWVINGQKAWATNGGIANVHVVIASVDPELGARGQAGVHHPARTRPG